MTPSPRELRLLAVDPTTRGFGFVVLEGPDSLIEWGTREAKGEKNLRSLDRIGELLQLYHPGLIVLEETNTLRSRRCNRVRDLAEGIRDLTSERKISCRHVRRGQVQAVFAQSGARTKHEIALAVADKFPELIPRLPPYRKPWMSEDERMAIFDACSFALAYFALRRGNQRRIP